MKIDGSNPETGEKYQAESDINDSFIQSMLKLEMSDNQIKKIIGDLNFSADVKSLLYSISKATIKAGQYILKIGRKIIDFVCLLFKEYPNATFGLIFGAIAGFLIAAIPIIGAVLSSLVTPILAVLGLGKGLLEDIKDKNLLRKIVEFNAGFEPLNT